MPFFGVKEILEPFLRGASEHPNEALFQKGSCTFSMSTTTKQLTQEFLEEFADFHLLRLDRAHGEAR
jgi:hypothetical protein